MVSVKLYGMLRKAVGKSEYRTSAATVGRLLKELSGGSGPDASRYLRHCVVLVNGKNADTLKGKRTRLNPGDVVAIYPRAAGG